jgi:hypothetical protein
MSAGFNTVTHHKQVHYLNEETIKKRQELLTQMALKQNGNLDSLPVSSQIQNYFSKLDSSQKPSSNKV